MDIVFVITLYSYIYVCYVYHVLPTIFILSCYGERLLIRLFFLENFPNSIFSKSLIIV